MKRKDVKKEGYRRMAIAFCVTCLLLTLLACSSVVLYNTASVLYGEEKVATVQKKGDVYEITLLSEKAEISSSKTENTLEQLLQYSPWLPHEIRFFLLITGGIWQGAQNVFAALISG